MKKSILLLTLLMVFLLTFSSNAFAYQTSGGKWSSAAPLKWYYDSYISLATKTAASNAASSWNNVGIPKANFSFSSGGSVYVTEAYDSTTDSDGWTTKTPCITCIYTSATIVINTYITTTYNNSGALQSVMTHEFGHVFGLSHNDGTKCIMISYTWGTGSRYGGYGLTTPQADDVNGVTSIYH
jgi:hypothetical protein